MVREISQHFHADLRFQAAAPLCLQEGAEPYLTDLFEVIDLAAIHAKYMTLMAKDIQLMQRIQGSCKWVKWLNCDFLPFKINVFDHFEHSKCLFNVGGHVINCTYMY